MQPNFFHRFILLIQVLLVHLPTYAAQDVAEDTSSHISELNEKALENLYKDPQKTRIYVYKALSLAKKENLKPETAEAYNILGLVNDTQGNYDEAIYYYLQSLKLFEEVGDEESAGVLLNNIGQFYYSQGNNSLALEYLYKALRIATDLNDELSKGYVYNNLALIHDENNNFKEALRYFQKAIKVYIKMEDDAGRAISLHNISWLYFGKEEYDSALFYVNEALKVDLENKDLEGIASNYNLLGEIYKGQGDYNKAILSYKESLTEAKKVEVFPLIAQANQGIAEAYFKNKDFKNALAYLENYSHINDSIFNEKNFKEIVTIQARYDARIQEKELSILQSQKALNNLTLSFRQTITFLLLGSGIVLLFVLFLLIRQNRQIGNVNKLLKDQIKKIDTQNQTLGHYNEELVLSKNRLKEFNETKDKFFSIISHDLKSPLNSLTGLLQLLSLQSDSITKGELLHLARSLGHSIDNLSDLLDNLLQWSMSQMGRIERNPVKVNLADVIEENIALLKMNAETKNIKVHSTVHSAIWIFADPNMIRFITRNLLSNAIKFTSKGGNVRLSCEVIEEYTHFIVEDDGVGIATADINKLFKIDQNFSTQGTAKEKGTGLGLILCKEFVEKNEGNIRVESVLEKGTKFIITLPSYIENSVLS